MFPFASCVAGSVCRVSSAYSLSPLGFTWHSNCLILKFAKVTDFAVLRVLTTTDTLNSSLIASSSSCGRTNYLAHTNRSNISASFLQRQIIARATRLPSFRERRVELFEAAPCSRAPFGMSHADNIAFLIPSGWSTIRCSTRLFFTNPAAFPLREPFRCCH